MNKSLLTNLTALILVVLGFIVPMPWQRPLLHVGLFALSGAVTNWFAVYMLFERVPGLYGSGVIPLRFEEFKLGIRTLIMQQFFSQENMDRFFRSMAEDARSDAAHPGIERLAQSVNLDRAFESLVDTIMESSFASMLGMLGGRKALESLRQPFIEKMRHFLAELGEDDKVMAALRQVSTETLAAKVELVVEQRLNELTPELVKLIIQDMIRQHLGWLVVWGGVFGGLIGLLSSLLISLP